MRNRQNENGVRPGENDAPLPEHCTGPFSCINTIYDWISPLSENLGICTLPPKDQEWTSISLAAIDHLH